MDEFIPAIIRDSYWFMYPFFYFIYKGKNIKRRMHFKSIAYTMSEDEYNNFYKEADAISSKRITDLSESNINYIIGNIPSGRNSIIDIGCGKGYLLDRIKKIHPDASLHGLDLENKIRYEEINFLKGSITSLPFPDNSFDIVICTHTIEHVIHLQHAVNELIRITKNRLIIVTPCQRYFYYTLDGHVNFFYKAEELLKYFNLPIYSCKKIDMDWIYIGDKDPSLR